MTGEAMFYVYDSHMGPSSEWPSRWDALDPAWRDRWDNFAAEITRRALAAQTMGEGLMAAAVEYQRENDDAMATGNETALYAEKKSAFLKAGLDYARALPQPSPMVGDEG